MKTKKYDIKNQKKEKEHGNPCLHKVSSTKANERRKEFITQRANPEALNNNSAFHTVSIPLVPRNFKFNRTAFYRV
jgi:hypothetical protein